MSLTRPCFSVDSHDVLDASRRASSGRRPAERRLPRPGPFPVGRPPQQRGGERARRGEEGGAAGGGGRRHGDGDEGDGRGRRCGLVAGRRSCWGHVGVTLGSRSGRARVAFGSRSGHSRVTLGSRSGRARVALGSRSGRARVTLGSCSGHARQAGIPSMAREQLW